MASYTPVHWHNTPMPAGPHAIVTTVFWWTPHSQLSKDRSHPFQKAVVWINWDSRYKAALQSLVCGQVEIRPRSPITWMSVMCWGRGWGLRDKRGSVPRDTEKPQAENSAEEPKVQVLHSWVKSRETSQRRWHLSCHHRIHLFIPCIFTGHFLCSRHHSRC